MRVDSHNLVQVVVQLAPEPMAEVSDPDSLPDLVDHRSLERSHDFVSAPPQSSSSIHLHEPNPVSWRCLDCNSDQWFGSENAWVCSKCFGTQFYRTDRSTKAVGQSGTWLYVPFANEAADIPKEQSPQAQPSKNSRRRRKKQQPPDPVGEPYQHAERAESEQRTDDPTVDPDAPLGATTADAYRRWMDDDHPVSIRPLPSVDRPKTQTAGSSSTSPDSKLLKALGQLVKPKEDYPDWSSTQGPSKGVRWKSGAPPSPPLWKYEKDDIRAWPKFEKKVRLWELQVAPYCSKKEASLLLYNSLTGEPEQELEHADVAQIYSDGGIDFILQQLRGPMEQKLVYQKRCFLNEYESISRYSGENLRTFSNRYRRAEKNLLSVGIDVSLMYDNEARGARLLDRSKLSQESQRLILVGTNQSMEFSRIVDAMLLQWPEYRGAPPIYNRDGTVVPFSKGSGKTTKSFSSASTSASTVPSNASASSSGKGGFKSHRKVFVTEVSDDAPPDTALPTVDEEAPDGAEQVDYEDDVPDNEDEGQEPEDDIDLSELAQVLTVTARRLSGLTLGRKFSGGKKSPAELKKSSHCGACGQLGHWHSDPECPMADKTKRGKDGPRQQLSQNQFKGKPSLQKTSNQQSTGYRKPNSAMVVHHEHGSMEVNDQESFGNLFTVNALFHVNKAVLGNDTIDELSHYMILDTACQRTCAGLRWAESFEKLLHQFKLKPLQVPSTDVFQFGKGEQERALYKKYFPIGLQETEFCGFLLGVCVLQAEIPLLVSHAVMRELDIVLSLVDMTMHVGKLNTVVPIHFVCGQLAVNILQFPPDVNRSPVWSHFSDKSIWRSPPPEVLLSQAFTTSSIRSPDDAADTTSMASKLEAGRFDSDDGHEEDRQGNGCGSPPQPFASGDLVSASTQDARANSESSGLRPQGVQEVRQCSRPIRKVPDMPSRVQMEPRARSVGNPRKIAQLVLSVCALANAVSGEYGSPHWHHTQEQAHGQAQASSQRVQFQVPDAIPSSTTAFHGLRGRMAHRDDARGSESTGVPHLPQRPVLQLEPGRTKSLPPRPQLQEGRLRQGDHYPLRSGGLGVELRVGRARRLKGQIQHSCKQLEAEDRIYHSFMTVHQRPPPNIDVFELFAGSAKFTLFASQFGLNALQPMDLNFGQDFKHPQTRQMIIGMVKKFRPWKLIMGISCVLWNLFNENLNYPSPERQALLQRLREEEYVLVEFAAQLAWLQMEEGRLFLIENPVKSRLWSLPCIEALMSHYGVWTSTTDAGAWGAEIDDKPVIKGLRFIGNQPGLDHVLNKRLTPAQREYCTTIQGKMTKASQVYPDHLVCAVLTELRAWVHQFEPYRFALPQMVYAVVPAQPVADLTLWQPVVEEVERRWQNTTRRPFYIEPTEPLGHQIHQLTRMDLCRIQAVSKPTMRRLLMDANYDYSHRAAFLEYNDSSRSFECEDLASIQFPKQKFAKPVRLAIFCYGTVPNVDAPKQPDDDEDNPRLPLPELPTDITFPGLPAGIPPESRRLVARLHCNLGHPNSTEMARMIAYYGGAPASVMTCIQCLHCATCERLRPPQKARPSTMPQLAMAVGQFGDQVQMDIFFTKTVDARTIPILGMIDRATGFHQGGLLPSRDSSEVFDLIHQIWLRPYGLPYRILADEDRAFLGDCRHRLESLGIILDFAPAEAHWVIGQIERRNMVLRTIFEKLVDQWSITTNEQASVALTAALHALNSSTYSRGRTAYQAVFGRIPRLPAGILSDDRTLASSPQLADNLAAKAELMRAEAQKHLIELDVSSHIKRAMLRKTRKTGIPDLQPGQTCAFWRWTKRGIKKRGAWVISRFLAWDPSAPGKLAWVRSGTTSSLVTAEQLRAAYGFESWNPSKEDIQALKDANADIQNQVFEKNLEDHTGPAPPEDQPDPIMAPDTPGTIAAEPVQDFVMPLGPAPSTPAPPPSLPVERHPSVRLEMAQARTQIESPTYQQFNQNTVVNQYRFGDLPQPRTPSQRGRSRSRGVETKQSKQLKPPTGDQTSSLPVVMDQQTGTPAALPPVPNQDQPSDSKAPETNLAKQPDMQAQLDSQDDAPAVQPEPPDTGVFQETPAPEHSMAAEQLDAPQTEHLSDHFNRSEHFVQQQPTQQSPSQAVSAEHQALPILPQKRTFESLTTLVYDEGTIERMPTSYDGSELFG